MINEDQEYKYHTNPLNVVVGILIGGLAGAVTMLLLAPQSGKEIQQKSLELRDRTSEIVEDTMAQIRSSVDKISHDGREKIKELKQHCQELAAEQLDHVSEAAQAEKKALQGS